MYVKKKKIKRNEYIAYSAAALIAEQTLIRLNFVNNFFYMDKSAVSGCQMKCIECEQVYFHIMKPDWMGFYFIYFGTSAVLHTTHLEYEIHI